MVGLLMCNLYFYPRSPCGERLQWEGICGMRYFYPRSPCGERPLRVVWGRNAECISIHALLAESDVIIPTPPVMIPISIHALLAESDCNATRHSPDRRLFLSTLSLRRATTVPDLGKRDIRISIHALLAESDVPIPPNLRTTALFLSTLSLRRATKRQMRCEFGDVISIHALLAESDSLGDLFQCRDTDFYPRSPCGERRGRLVHQLVGIGISIHALLAESDG